LKQTQGKGDPDREEYEQEIKKLVEALQDFKAEN
jgi:hypothetical protein